MEVISRHPANSREIGGLNRSHPRGSQQLPASAQVLRTTSTRATHRYHQRSQTTPPMWCGIIGGGPRALATLLCAALVLWLRRSAFLQFRGGHAHEREQPAAYRLAPRRRIAGKRTSNLDYSKKNVWDHPKVADRSPTDHPDHSSNYK